MFTYALAEPRHPVASALQSTFIHASLIAGAVIATRAVPVEFHEAMIGPIDLTFSRPLTAPHSVASPLTPIWAQPAHLPTTVPMVPIIDPGVPLLRDPIPADPVTLIPGGTDPGVPGILVGDSMSAATILAESEVDELPTLITAGILRYPAVLHASGVEGTVTLTFVIDTEGRVEADGIQVITATQQGFVPAAKEAVLTSRFRPAWKHHLPVRVRVRQVISFRR